jgi:hypothetical protein
MEVVANPPAVRAPADRQRQRSRATNDPRFLSKQPPTPRAVDRRRRDLVEAFMAALGGPSGVNDLTQVMVRRAAELTTAVEMARADMLNGVPTDMLALVRLEGVAARAVRVLGIKTEPPVSKNAARVAAIREQRWAEQERQAQAAKSRSREAATENTKGRPDDRT